MEQIIEALKSIREKFAITMLEISQGCGVTERSVIAWLNNNSKPHRQHLIKIEAFVKRTKAKAEADEKREIEKCIPLILSIIYNGDYDFSPVPKPGEAGIVCPGGRLRKVITLLQCAEITGKRVADPVLLKAVEAIARKGLIQILNLQLDRRMSNEDVKIWLDLGMAKREMPSGQIIPKRLYQDKPIKADEIEEGEKGGHLILDVEKRIEAMQKQKQKSCEAQFGSSGHEKEMELYKEKIEDDFNQRNKQQEIINALKKGDKKMEGDYKADEFDTLALRKKTREFYEKKIKNDSQVTQVVYNCHGERITIEPGETKIVLKMRHIEKMPVEKEIEIKK